MTLLLSEAFDKLSQLPELLQDEVAQQLLSDWESELRWQTAFTTSQTQLDKLAQQALAEFEAGRVKPLGFGEL
jgi:hypothetical protein